MWPGDQQSGGQQNPHGAPIPPQQPPGVPGGYGRPNPYAQPGSSGGQTPPGPPQPPVYAAPAQPYGVPASPYAQPGYQQPAPGYGAPQQWGAPTPGAPAGPPPGKRRNTSTIVVTVTAAVAVVAAAVVGAVYLTGGSAKNDAKAGPSTSASAPASPTATPTPTPTAPASDPAADGGSGDAPRGAPVEYKPVVPGWKVVRRDKRNVLFDVPPDWSVDSQSMTIGFADKDGKPVVAMSGPAFYKHDMCTSGTSTYDRAAVGTKGANGATSVRNAAETQAKSWAYWGYQDKGRGTFSPVLDSKPFQNTHGISGWQARATASNIPMTTKCSAPAGEAWTVAWLDPTQTDPAQKLVVWVLYADRGVPDALAQSVVDKIQATIRFEKQS